MVRTTKWDCKIDGVPYKMIKEKEGAVEEWMASPKVTGPADGLHIVVSSGVIVNVHVNHFSDRRKDGKNYPVDYKIGSVAVGPQTKYVNCSGAVRTPVIPLEPSIKEIWTGNASGGSMTITTDASGYVFFANIYSGDY